MEKNTISKKQLANAMQITLPTLRAWLEPYRSDLERLGVKPTDKLLKPPAAKWVCKKLELDFNEVASK